MKFLDQVKIYIKAGNGGDGSPSFRREKYVEFGGPAGPPNSTYFSLLKLGDPSPPLPALI